MAYPQIASYKTGVNDTQSYSTYISKIDGTQAGDLILLFVTSDGTSSIDDVLYDEYYSTSNWWQPVGQVINGGQNHAVFYSELIEPMINIEIIHGFTRTSWIMIRIPNAKYESKSTTATGSSATPDPAEYTPGWPSGTEILWIASSGWDYKRACTGFPSNFTSHNYSSVSGVTAGTGTAIAALESTTMPQNPGSFTIAASDTWSAFTIAIRTRPVSSTTIVPVATTTAQGEIPSIEVGIDITIPSGEAITSADLINLVTENIIEALSATCIAEGLVPDFSISLDILIDAATATAIGNRIYREIFGSKNAQITVSERMATIEITERQASIIEG